MLHLGVACKSIILRDGVAAAPNARWWPATASDPEFARSSVFRHRISTPPFNLLAFRLALAFATYFCISLQRQLAHHHTSVAASCPYSPSPMAESAPTLNPQQARLAALNRLKARDRFAAQSSSAAPASGSGPGANAAAGSSRHGGAQQPQHQQQQQQQSLVNKAQNGPANSRNGVVGQEAEAPLKRDSSLVSHDPTVPS